MAPKKVDKKEKKHQIMLAAIKVFAEKGLKNTKVADITEAAGIGKGTLYEYFTNRDTIFVDACNYMTLEMMEQVRQIARSDLSPIEKIRSITRLALESTSSFTPEMSSFFIDYWAEGIRGNAREDSGLIDIKPVYDEFRQMFQNILQDGIDAGQFREMNTYMFASAMIGVIDGLQIQWVLDPQTFKFNKMTEAVIDLFINGIRKTD